MVYEIVDNAVDEALAGHCRNITTTIGKWSKVVVHDDGRGIPVDIHPKTGKSALETILVTLHAWWKFEKGAYKISGDVAVVGETDKRWTTITFIPDDTIFDTMEFMWSTLVTRIKHAAYLTPGVTFTLIDEVSGKQERFLFAGGIKTWLTNLVWTQKVLSPQVHIEQEGKEVMVEIACQFVNSANNTLLSFVNNITTKDWGTHVLWFKDALLEVINEVAAEKGEVDKKIGQFQTSDVTDGLYAIVSVKVPEPQFEGQTKWRLWNGYVRKEVAKVVKKFLQDYFAENEDMIMNIIEKVKLSAKARVAAKLARETVLRKNAILGWVLPGKLSDCSIKKMEGTELYIVEGDSAWGSAKQARNSSFQAILPLRGKVLNTEQASLQKILANNEVKALIMAIGAWMKESYDESKLRYERIVIMTDADVDGAHIRTLLLTFFFRYMRPLVDSGHLYIAVPPLYKLKHGKKERYIYPPDDQLELPAIMQKYDFDTEKTSAQRYKGLGEMNPDQLWDTTMDPDQRKMMKVEIEDAEEADRLFRVLMGDDVPSRKHFILTHAKYVKDLDV